MSRLSQRLRWSRRRSGSQTSGIDLGNGRMLDTEDVLDSHFRRIAAARQTPRPGQEHVVVQIEGDNMIAAITVLAPKLAPLTELAEVVADAMPAVHPAPQFRQHLHQALERTHRQHAAQRVFRNAVASGGRGGRATLESHRGGCAASLRVDRVIMVGRKAHRPPYTL